VSGGGIVEREQELEALVAAAEEAKAGDGSVVLIVGEAGIGKSSLVHALKSVLPAEVRLFVGCCDDLATPRVLGPLRDLTGSVGSTLAQALESGDRSRVSDALRAELDRPEEPSVLVVEDAHWADEATLDVLRFLVRRVASLPAVLVLTYRDVQLATNHPLQQLLGLASSTPRLRRLTPARLSADAVRRLGADTGIDSDEVFAVTGGNPFFVTEVLASGDVGGVPHTVAEAVRARLGNLDEPTRDAVEQLAVIPSAAERWLVEAIVPGGLAPLTAAERRGVLTVWPMRVVFVHELTRRAVVDSIPAARRVACNQAVLSALLDRREQDVDLSRIVHHAVQAGAVEVIVQYGPIAAREAAAAGSHREAVAHYRLVLEHRQVFPAETQADLLDEFAVECHTVGLSDVGIPALEDAVRLRRALGDPRKLGLSLRWLSRIHWWAGARAQAEAAGAEAIEILESAGDEQALAMALSNQSQLHMLDGRRADSIAIGRRAITMARALDDAALLSHALNNVGTALWDDLLPEGQAMLEEALQVALDAGAAEHACRAYVNIVWHLLDVLEFAEAERILDEAIDLADEAEFDGFRRYMRVTRSIVYLARGWWDDAEREIEWAADAEPIIRCQALIVRGTIKARRGHDDAIQLMEEAWAIAQQLGEAQRTGPAAAALLEAAWLNGDAPHAAKVVTPEYEHVRRFGRLSAAAEVGYWMRAAGQNVPINNSEHPYTLLAEGHWEDAADAWRHADCPYEQALARTHSSDVSDLLSALTTLDALGAEPLARRVRLQLKALGVTRVPRGRIRTTRDNPAGLTERQTDVLRLLAEGLTNAEIAARLVLSVRTVDTHVGAILNKLDAKTRRDAAVRAEALGLLDVQPEWQP
jgi:DNA-binding CsgD family transcriptional regulator/tetratricopeptide (TPR) repeat protein/energy-coupling factor transporter ATP-binding protein EcfA2